jgi:hypothetical protein
MTCSGNFWKKFPKSDQWPNYRKNATSPILFNRKILFWLIRGSVKAFNRIHTGCSLVLNFKFFQFNQRDLLFNEMSFYIFLSLKLIDLSFILNLKLELNSKWRKYWLYIWTDKIKCTKSSIKWFDLFECKPTQKSY